MSEQKHPVIHELFDRKFLLMLLGAFAIIALGGGYLLFLSPNMADATYLPALRIAFPACMAMLLLAILRVAFCRVHIDESGVTADRLPLGQTSLRWEEIRTAAIVHLHVGQNSDPIIVLSTLPPEQVLSRKALLGLPGLSPEEHVRVFYSSSRAAAVQHYLHMTLPEYSL